MAKHGKKRDRWPMLGHLSLAMQAMINEGVAFSFFVKMGTDGQQLLCPLVGHLAPFRRAWRCAHLAPGDAAHRCGMRWKIKADEHCVGSPLGARGMSATLRNRCI